MSKIIVPGVILLLLLICISAEAAIYLIQLRDGHEYATSLYWIEGDEIRFSICGGVLGIPRQEILRIRIITERDQPNYPEPQVCRPQLEKPKPQVPQEAKKGFEQAGGAPADSAEPKTRSQAFQNFRELVIAFEKKLRPLPSLSKEELLNLAAEGEALKQEMLGHPEVEQLTPLLLELYDAFQRIEEVYIQRN